MYSALNIGSSLNITGANILKRQSGSPWNSIESRKITFSRELNLQAR